MDSEANLVDQLQGSVVVATMNRPDQLRRCLQHISRQTRTPAEVIVVDSSSSSDSRDVVRAEFPGVLYRTGSTGSRTWSESRQLAMSAVTADVVAFLDDDANARPDWLAEHLRRYGDPSVGGVGGRVSTGTPGEEKEGIESIGRLLPDGRLTGNFGADPGSDVDVDHLPGANMSCRVEALAAVGGIHGRYAGTWPWEGSDTSLRISRAGYRVVFAPTALVERLVDPNTSEQPVDHHSFHAQRNHVLLLVRVFGWRHLLLRRYLITAARETAAELLRSGRSIRGLKSSGPGKVSRSVVVGCGRAAEIPAGLLTGLALAGHERREDLRLDRRTKHRATS